MLRFRVSQAHFAGFSGCDGGCVAGIARNTSTITTFALAAGASMQNHLQALLPEAMLLDC